jgi:predicted nucleic acid-binding protein
MPFFIHSKKVYDLAVRHQIEGYVSVLSLKDVFYICSKDVGRNEAFRIIEIISCLMEILGVSPEDSIDAMGPEKLDYEDGIIMESAKNNKIDAIVTRDKDGFYESDVLIIHPEDIDKYLDGTVYVGSTAMNTLL